MLPIPQNCLARFNQALRLSAVPVPFHVHYRKWLRYFLDFCSKYPPPEDKSAQVRFFHRKAEVQKTNAATMYTGRTRGFPLFRIATAEIFSSSSAVEEKSPPPSRLAIPSLKARNSKGIVAKSIGASAVPTAAVAEPSPPFGSPAGKRYNEWRCLQKSTSPAWDQVIEKLSAEIKVRHYSRKTLKAYADWGRKFQRYLDDKPPEKLASHDVKEYLTSLAVKQRVTSSTQNQAFNALLFFFGMF